VIRSWRHDSAAFRVSESRRRGLIMRRIPLIALAAGAMLAGTAVI
jgi:hypothetical protein